MIKKETCRTEPNFVGQGPRSGTNSEDCSLLQGYIYLNTQDIDHQTMFEIYTVEITATSPTMS